MSIDTVTPRSHLAGCLVPLALATVVGAIALLFVGLPMALFLGLFGTDPFTSVFFVLMTHRPTLAGVAGALALGLAMWAAHLLNRRIAWPRWLLIGMAAYAAAALAVSLLVPQTSVAS